MCSYIFVPLYIDNSPYIGLSTLLGPEAAAANHGAA